MISDGTFPKRLMIDKQATDGQSMTTPKKRCPRELHAQSWIHANWSYLFWDDAENIALLVYRFSQILCMTKQLKYIVLADFIRYAIMFYIGGVCADVDFECLYSFDRVIQDRQFIVS